MTSCQVLRSAVPAALLCVLHAFGISWPNYAYAVSEKMDRLHYNFHTTYSLIIAFYYSILISVDVS